MAGTTDNAVAVADHAIVTRHAISVLVVDDLEPFHRAAAAVIAATDGFVVVGQAFSGEAALDLMSRVRVDLVLMDVNMPGMGGLEAAVALRDGWPCTRVVLMSVHLSEELRDAAETRGALFCHKEQFGPDKLEALWAAARTEPG